MKTEQEIQRAHDRFRAILLREVPNPFPGVDLRPAMDVLCWVLDHDHNHSFADNLAEIDKFLRKQGYRYISADEIGQA